MKLLLCYRKSKIFMIYVLIVQIIVVDISLTDIYYEGAYIYISSKGKPQIVVQ